MPQSIASTADALRARYLDTIERIVCNLIYRDTETEPDGSIRAFDTNRRTEGRDWPSTAHSMMGLHRLHHLRGCVERVVADDVPGDLIEAGVWRGGGLILMRAVLEAYGDLERHVWGADSFRGLPPPKPEKYPSDSGLHLENYEHLAVSLEAVRDNVRAYGLLDDRIHFVEGLFSETLKDIPVERFSLIRLDGDLYESTIDSLEALYPRLAMGGFAIIDDFGAVPACAAAVRDYRGRHAIAEPIETIDWTGAFWRKTAR